METASVHKQTAVSAKSIAEWLPELTSLLSQDVLASTRKNPRKTAAVSAVPTTSEKFRPLTIAEMRADIDALTGKSSKKSAQTSKTASMKKRWNSSVKVTNKRIGHTSEGQMRNNPVRKVLNFQPKPQTQYPKHPNAETPNFPKPEFRAKKSIHQSKGKEPRISGVYKIPETPVEDKKTLRNRVSIADKENFAARIPNRETLAPRIPVPKFNVVRKQFLSPKAARKQKVPDTPLSNDSWRSSCDASFLQKEKEIETETEEVEQHTAAIAEATLKKIAEVSAPVSTPFKEYRNVEEYFSYSSEMDATLVKDNTIMSFDKTVEKVERKDNSVIVSLCDMFNKAKVTQTDSEKPRMELDILLEIKKETENNIKIQKKLLNYVNKLIQNKTSASTSKKIQQRLSNILVVSNENILLTSPQKKVHKSPIKSPSYKIPKRTPCLRKVVFHKSMPNMRDKTPEKVENSKARIMYMGMKEGLNFLNTPVVNHSRAAVPDTPALASKNLKKQLNKLFDGS